MTNSEIRFYRQAVREGNLAALDLFFKDFSSKDKEEQAQLIISGCIFTFTAGIALPPSNHIF